MRESKCLETDSVEGAVGGELALADLRNSARVARACWFARRWSERPHESFAEIGRTSAGRQAIYKFLESDFIRYDALVESHALLTYRRIEAAGTAIAIHDTTEFEPPSDCKGMGRLRGKSGGKGPRGM